jgi:uncharacterized membrane protein YvbJ
MRTCSKCGGELKENVKFCKTCGGQALLDDKKARVMGRDKTWVKPTVVAAVVVLVSAGAFGFLQFKANRMGSRPMKTGNKVLDMLEGLHAEGHTIVMVTHSEENAKRAGRTIEIRDGEVVK